MYNPEQDQVCKQFIFKKTDSWSSRQGFRFTLKKLMLLRNIVSIFSDTSIDLMKNTVCFYWPCIVYVFGFSRLQQSRAIQIKTKSTSLVITIWKQKDMNWTAVSTEKREKSREEKSNTSTWSDSVYRTQEKTTDLRSSPQKVVESFKWVANAFFHFPFKIQVT